MTTSAQALVDQHLAAYCEPDAHRRMETLRRIWHSGGRLVDPPFESAGHAGIADQAALLLEQFPGHRFVRHTEVDAHHEFLRYGWRLVDAQGAPVMEGLDLMELDVDGRISRVVGFFGMQPAAVPA